MHELKDMEPTLLGKTDDSPSKDLSVDGVLATFELSIKTGMIGEVWVREQVSDALATIGLAHPEATSILIIFRKP